LAIVIMPPVDAIGAAGGGSKAAMAYEVASDSANNRAFEATPRPSLRTPGGANSSDADHGRNKKQVFHESLLLA
jgi:hypothetical protein